MAKVYGGSLCTLTALSSKDSTEGCRIDANIQSSLSRYLDVDFGPPRVRFFEDEPKYWHSEYGDNPRMIRKQPFKEKGLDSARKKAIYKKHPILEKYASVGVQGKQGLNPTSVA